MWAFARLLLICITLPPGRRARLAREEQALAGTSFCAQKLRKRNRLSCIAWVLGSLLLAALPLRAQRLPVLAQIDVPFRTYYREMYLPHLTSGPSSLAWMPDSGSVIFSMQGCLWRQNINSTTAEQLTSGPGYDYQPDVSSDGRWVIYAKYYEDAIELWLLDLSSGKSKQLTNTKAVNVEPRWSPAFRNGDARIVFVSTQFNRHFHIFVAQFDAVRAELKEVQRLTAETYSKLPRVLYGQFDHEISPSWSPDGKEVVFVSNHNRTDGAGGFWRMKSTPLLVDVPVSGHGPFGMMARRVPPVVKEESHQILDEKTTWRVRPDLSPDGKRMIYAMYLGSPKDGGRYELLSVASDGGRPQMLSDSGEDHNDFNPRWSPDGKSIAFISTRSGKSSLWMEDARGAERHEIVQKDRKYFAPTATIRFQSAAPAGTTSVVSVRISISGEDGRAYAPDGALILADESFDRKKSPFELHYFDLNITRLRPSSAITVPAGKVHIEITRGFGYQPAKINLAVKDGESRVVPVKLRPLRLPESPAVRWIAGDLHVSSKLGGAYGNTAQSLLEQMRAEDLGVAARLTDIRGQQDADIGVGQPAASFAPPLAAQHVLYGAESHSDFWGDIDVLNTASPTGRRYVSYPPVPARILPTNLDIADRAHAFGKNVLVGYTHLFREPLDPDDYVALMHALPLDVALGKVDYYELLSSGADPNSSAAVWYSLLNLGFHVPVAAGSDAIAGYFSSRGPLGRDRVYVRVPNGPFRVDSWLEGLKHGRSFATNGPLLRFTLAGQQVGGQLKLPAPKTVRFTAALRSNVPVDHLEIVCNGEVAISIPLNQEHNVSNAVGGLHLARSGWCILRAWAEKTEDLSVDDYPYATTSPIYITVAGARPGSHKDAAYFLKWMDRIQQNAQRNTGYGNDEQKAQVLKTIEAARKVYEQLAK
jgi:Tol biopolymer transport system component